MIPEQGVRHRGRPKRKKVLIIDEHPVFREGFKARLERDSLYAVIGGAETGDEGIMLAGSLQPDLVVMEVSLPDQDAFQVIRTLHRLFPRMPVIILSAYRQVTYITRALQSGANGYLIKESSCESIIEGLGAVIRGEYYLDCSLSPNILFQINLSPRERSANGPSKHLTPREQEIMVLLAEGASRKQIAQSLSISPRTVENHAASIMKKMSLKNPVDLVRCAAKLGLINVDEWKRMPVDMAYSGSVSMRQAPPLP